MLPVLLVSASGTVQAASDARHAHLIGHAVDEVWRDQPQVLRCVREALCGKEARGRGTLDNQTLDFRFAPVLDAPGHVSACTVLGTRTARVNEALRFLFRQLPGAMWATDRELRLTFAIGRLRATAGLLSERFVGHTVAEMVAEVHANPQIVTDHEAALRGEKCAFRYDYGERTYEIALEPLYDETPEPAGCIAVALDITERRRAEDRLIRSEAMLSEAQRTAHIGSWEWDVASNMVTWSPELARIHGLVQPGLCATYDEFLSLTHPADANAVRTRIFEAFRQASSFVFDYRLVRPDKSVRMLHCRGDAVTDGHGKVVRLAGSCMDITERWVAEQHVERSVSLLTATLESTADGILVVDTSGRIVAFNGRFQALWQLPHDISEWSDDTALLTRVVDQLEDPAAFQLRVQELYTHPAAESLDVLRFRDGRVFERYSQPQRLGDEIVGRVWSFRDVTERERLLRNALLLSDAGRLLASLDLDKALDAMAHLAIPILGDGCAIDLFASGDGPHRLLSVAREPARPVTVEVPLAVHARVASIFNMGATSCMSVPLLAHGDLLGALSFVASPGRRYAEADLKLAKELAARAELAITNARLYQQTKEALQARDQFLSIAAHEIRGPVAGLHLAVQTLSRNGPLPAAAQRAISVVEREDRRITRLVSELLDVSGIRRGLVHFELEEVSLTEITREVAARLTAEVSKSGSALSVSAQPAIVGRWDRLRLEQVVTNLLSNAVKFGDGKPIEVEVTGTPETATLVVRDHGIGIAASKQAVIFQPFERAVSGRHYGGLGLGLYIARRVVEGLGGSIRVDSAPGHGTAFTIRLPRRPPAPAPQQHRPDRGG